MGIADNRYFWLSGAEEKVPFCKNTKHSIPLRGNSRQSAGEDVLKHCFFRETGYVMDTEAGEAAGLKET